MIGMVDRFGLPFEPRGVAVRAKPEFDAVVTALPRPAPPWPR